MILLSTFYTSFFTLVALLFRKPVPLMMMPVVSTLPLETGRKLIEEVLVSVPQCYFEPAHHLFSLKALSYAPLIPSLLYPIPPLLAAILFFEKTA